VLFTVPPKVLDMTAFTSGTLAISRGIVGPGKRSEREGGSTVAVRRLRALVRSIGGRSSNWEVCPRLIRGVLVSV